ncbi:MAG: PEGA domain-containing protein [Opitutaceae bacterium]
MRKTPSAPPAATAPATDRGHVPESKIAPPAAAPSAGTSENPPPVSELMLLVESAPPGAIIVVEGRPVGKAPVRVAVPVTPLGFFRDYVEIRARFVAADATEVTCTAMEEFTPREKVPAVLHFTPDGAQRTGY